MIRSIVLACAGAVLLGCMPAYGQDMPELDGAPGPLKIPKPAVVQPKVVKPPVIQPKIVKPVAAKPVQPDAAKLKVTEATLAKQAEAQAAERVRLDGQAADLKAREAGLVVRAAELAAGEKRLADQRAAQDAKFASQQAELERQRAEPPRQTAAQAPARGGQLAGRERDDDRATDSDVVEPATGRFRYAQVDLDSARRSCARAGVDAARARDFYSARYDTAPRLFEGRTLELRGMMRLEDRRGYMIVDTVCEVDADGEAQHFAFLR